MSRHDQHQTLGQLLMGGLVLLALPAVLALIVWVFRQPEQAVVSLSPSDPGCDAVLAVTQDPRSLGLGSDARSALDHAKADCGIQ